MKINIVDIYLRGPFTKHIHGSVICSTKCLEEAVSCTRIENCLKKFMSVRGMTWDGNRCQEITKDILRLHKKSNLLVNQS